MASSLECSEEMIEESPEVTKEMRERNRSSRSQLPFHKQKEITAFSDTNLLQNQQVFPAMLAMERACSSYVGNYFRTIQTDITPEMKTDVAFWMFEVCEEERMHSAVFIRAAQYMDKFLSLQKVSRYHLQLLGAVCILISSKITGTTITPHKLAEYTANSVTTHMLLEWENMVLGVLKWDMYGIVSADFVQHILNLLPKKTWDTPTVSERINTFIAYCAVDFQFGVYMPSIIASASIVAALTPFLTKDSLNQVISTIQSTTKIDGNQLKGCINHMTSKVKITIDGRRKHHHQNGGELSSNPDSADPTNSRRKF